MPLEEAATEPRFHYWFCGRYCYRCCVKWKVDDIENHVSGLENDREQQNSEIDADQVGQLDNPFEAIPVEDLPPPYEEPENPY
ncbi:Oidioi.mRNA.OKI2018_I69.PAR.g10856.t1.cds [Oikopleura dioica]|uniref:Oidioi.mRNA.OKI2018_I69.PAR.g10856.t1.cds n=1 Tax=Oikopleura dioica TaxID=34765 RepID=A0ABN7RW37_OIKDI|nr:Oidioi.mRNA.OKI2018_I69.PAR.g10856.t1.cds [Oikopleura dioica]